MQYRFSVGTSYGEEARTRFVSLFIMLLESAFTRVTVQRVVAPAINWNTSFLSWLLCTYIARRSTVKYQESLGIYSFDYNLCSPRGISYHATTSVFGVSSVKYRKVRVLTWNLFNLPLITPPWCVYPLCPLSFFSLNATIRITRFLVQWTLRQILQI